MIIIINVINIIIIIIINIISCDASSGIIFRNTWAETYHF